MFAFKRMTGVLALSLLSCGLLASHSTHGGDGGSRLTVAIEQDGAPVPIDKNTVTLRRAPFSIVTTLNGSLNVAVSASTSDALAKSARKRRLQEPFTNIFKAVPLEPRNAGQTLFLAQDPLESYADYSFRSPDDHDFNEVKLSGAQLTGTLQVSKLFADGAATALADSPGNDLYLVFATTENKGGKLKITASEHLHIRFQP